MKQVIANVKAAYVGTLFAVPNKYDVEVSVEKYRSNWGVRKYASNGFGAIVHVSKTKKAAIEKAKEIAGKLVEINARAMQSA